VFVYLQLNAFEKFLKISNMWYFEAYTLIILTLHFHIFVYTNHTFIQHTRHEGKQKQVVHIALVYQAK